MSFLDAKVPPTVVALAVAVLMWLGARCTPILALPTAVRAGAGLAAAVVGLCVITAAIAAFRRARTTPNPMRPGAAAALVVSGVYRFTRNPMYLGILFLLVGWAVFLASPLALVASAAFVLYMNRYQIGPEERAMSAAFGADYAAYRARVRRWL